MKLERTNWAVEQSVSQVELCYLVENDWDDFGFRTLFEAVLFDSQGRRYDLGYVRILEKGMRSGRTEFERVSRDLGARYCSLGSSVEYYRKLSECPEQVRTQYLRSVRDAVFDPDVYARFEDEIGFQKSLLRDVSRRDVGVSFPRALNGDADLTPYDFRYSFKNDDQSTGELSFSVEPQSRPPSNIHVLIGRNGVGKTRLLAGIADSLTENRATTIGMSGQMTFFDESGVHNSVGSFLNLVIVAYSVFDRFDPIAANGERTETAIPHYYIGVKSAASIVLGSQETAVRLKSRNEVREEFRDAVHNILGDPNKTSRLLRAFSVLSSDPMIAEMKLDERLVNGESREETINAFELLSSGHKAVILTITRLVELVSDRSLVLIDEPETHLHPPLLASFVRALSDLLQSRNGVAVVATHSPVLLQEVPSSCVQLIARTGGASQITRPDTETFGENVGTLTRRVFELEVENSGFYRMLVDSANGRSFDEVMSLFADKVGGEGRAVVRSRSLRANREEPPATD